MQIDFHQAELRFADKVALRALTLSLSERRVGVIGLNGSGKTSFARLINGLAKPSSGRVTVDGLDTVHGLEGRARAGRLHLPEPRQPDHPANHSRRHWHGAKGAGAERRCARRRGGWSASRFGITHLADRRPHELSGGELQLAALAAVTATRPDLVIFDEPTNQLDLKNRARVEAAIRDMPEQAIIISHDLDLVQGLDRVLVFHDGGLAFDGAAAPAIARYREIALA